MEKPAVPRYAPAGRRRGGNLAEKWPTVDFLQLLSARASARRHSRSCAMPSLLTLTLLTESARPGDKDPLVWPTGAIACPLTAGTPHLRQCEGSPIRPVPHAGQYLAISAVADKPH